MSAITQESAATSGGKTKNFFFLISRMITRFVLLFVVMTCFVVLFSLMNFIL